MQFHVVAVAYFLVLPLLGGVLATGCGAEQADGDRDSGDESGADASAVSDASLDPLVADVIVAGPPASDGPYGDPSRAVNGVRGGGAMNGGMDVFSLGLTPADRELVLGWSAGCLTDGPGDDLVVFENPFDYGAGVFMELVVVSMSRDGETWIDFPHDYVTDDETKYVADPAAWVGFAGKTPVAYETGGAVDAFDDAAGGDAFDLEDLGDSELAQTIRTQGAAFVRLRTATTLINPDTGALFVGDALGSGPDIDGVVARRLDAPDGCPHP